MLQRAKILLSYYHYGTLHNTTIHEIGLQLKGGGMEWNNHPYWQQSNADPVLHLTHEELRQKPRHSPIYGDRKGSKRKVCGSKNDC